jgi:hypothetical protein
MITVSGYQIEGEIYQNSSRAYYQATRKETNEKVIEFKPLGGGEAQRRYNASHSLLLPDTTY